MARYILNIHGIGTPQRDLEPGEAPYWISEDLFAQTVDMAARAGDVAFTFDDSNISDLTIGAPRLEAAGLRAEFFVLTGRIGQAGSLGEDDIGALLERGHAIGSHGADHVDWTTLDADGIAHEIAGSKARLEAICNRPVTGAGIPFGRYNARVLKALRAAGYERAYSSDGGAVGGITFPTPRSSLSGDMDAAAVADILAGRESAKKKLRRALTTRLKRVL